VISQSLFFRLLRYFIIWCLIIYMAISAIFASTVLILLYPLIFISPGIFRYISETFVDIGWSFFPFSNEIMGNNNIIFYGDKVPDKENVLLISNHLSNADWLQIFGFAFRRFRVGYVKPQAKKVFKYIPLLGSALLTLGVIFLDRNWEKDKKILHKALSGLKDKPVHPFWLLIFPEGHRMSSSSLDDSISFSKKNDLPVLKNVLLPRVKGFSSSYLEIMDTIDAVYDLTLVYTQTPGYFWSLCTGAQQLDCHVLVKRYEISSLPKDESGLSQWMYNQFTQKDKDLQLFKETGKFEQPIIDDPFPMDRMKKAAFQWNIILILSFSMVYVVGKLCF